MSEATQRLEALVMDQFAGELELSKESGLYDNHKSSADVPPPSDAQTAYRLLITRLTTQQVVAILETAKRPQLQMEPITSFERVVGALDGHKKMPRQIDTYVDPGRRVAWTRQDANAGIGNSVGGWNLGIIDAIKELDANPNLHGTLEQKCVQNSTEWDCSGLRSPHPRRYALAQLRAILLQGREPLDDINWSVLNDGTGNTSVVPSGCWDDDRVNFSEGYPELQSVNVRFRPEVVVKAA